MMQKVKEVAGAETITGNSNPVQTERVLPAPKSGKAAESLVGRVMSGIG